jgi:hypothetical protein
MNVQSARFPSTTIAHIDDSIYGRIVAHERLLMPFSEAGAVTHVIASLKTISEDGGFEIKNLIRGNDTSPGRSFAASSTATCFIAYRVASQPMT